MSTWAEIETLCGEDERALIASLNLKWLFESEDVPAEEDKLIAWELYVELKTRITTQPLHFLDGDEGTALTSVFNLFSPSRELLKEHGREGYRTAALVESVLNQVIRPFTAKWHRRKRAGDLARDDATREFRGELKKLSPQLQQLGRLLYAIARGSYPVEQTDKSCDRQDDSPPPPIPFDELLGFPATKKWKKEADGIRKMEKDEIIRRRAAIVESDDADGSEESVPPNSHDLVGLAVSGGGIRSATFALGVVQGLAQRGIFRQVDLMSTVSGGGYLGAFLSSMMNSDPVDPFDREGDRESRSIRFLRNHSRYILPASFWSWVRTLGQAAYGIVSNLIILSSIVFAAVLLTHFMIGDQLIGLSDTIKRDRPAPADLFELGWGACGAIALAGLHLLYLPHAQQRGRQGGRHLEHAARHENRTLVVFGLAGLVVALNYFPLAHFGYLKLMHGVGQYFELNDDGGEGWSLRATLVSISSAIGLIMARSESIRAAGTKVPLLRKGLFLLLWMAGPAMGIYFYFEMCRVYVAVHPAYSVDVYGISIGVWPIGLPLILMIVALLYSVSINVNFTSLHRFYRNRLAETYLLKHRGDEVQSTESSSGSKQLLSEMRATPDATAPYHLINAALNLPQSEVPELRGRQCDFFLFSKHFCGSQVLRYHSTKDWENADPHLDLGTAVAISGAAAAPQMGMGSIPGGSFLLTLLNVRLGYWLRKPSSEKMTSQLKTPGPWYLLREASNVVHERSAFVNLSDGGHLENLGIYELLRRRCKFVIAIDGECDPDLDCPSLMKLQHFAKVDLGVEIELDVDRLKWVDVIPSEATPSSDEDGADAIVRTVKERIRYNPGHFTVGRIQYPSVNVEGREQQVFGWLIYVKLSITGNEPDYVHDYRRRFPDFPHQSTADQVFEDDQFEAYRCLGQHVADDLFSEELLSETSSSKAREGSLPVSEWCQELVSNFFRGKGLKV